MGLGVNRSPDLSYSKIQVMKSILSTKTSLCVTHNFSNNPKSALVTHQQLTLRKQDFKKQKLSTLRKTFSVFSNCVFLQTVAQPRWSYFDHIVD